MRSLALFSALQKLRVPAGGALDRAPAGFYTRVYNDIPSIAARGFVLTASQSRLDSDMADSERKPVTLKDIARHCGVSLMTASWALRGDSTHVSLATRKQIRAAARKLGYDSSRSHVARRLRYTGDKEQAPINHLIALTFSWEFIETAYFTRLLKGIGSVLHREGFALLTDWTLTDDSETSDVPVVFNRGEVDGAIVIEGRAVVETVAALRRTPGFGQRPVVSLFVPVDGCSSVLGDDRLGGYMLAEHLLRLGHRHLAYTNIVGWTHQQRHEGYRDAIRAFGLDPAAHLHVLDFKHDEPLDVDLVIRQHLAGHPATTAFLAGNDHLALRIAESCARLGLRIPQDIALVGYDDTHVLPDGSGGNLLTSVRQPLFEAGCQAASLLLQQIQQRDLPLNRVTFPVELVIRQSSALPERR